MHGDKQAYLETVNELSATKSVPVSYAAIDWEHHQVEAICQLADVLQLSKILLLMGNRVYVLVKLFTVDCLSWHCFGEESCIPVVQVACMENALAFCLYNP